MYRFFILTIGFLFFFKSGAPAQEKSKPKEMFLEAESYFLYEEYNEALPLYIKLSLLYPSNDNINYRIGRCYLNIPYEKQKSVEYLLKASKNINPDYKEGSLKETRAPKDVFFYLGNAYRINNQLDKAISMYSYFKSIADSAKYDFSLVRDQITACENAKKLEKTPIDLSFTNLGDEINTRSSELNPVVSGDESTLIFNTQLPFYLAVYCSKKVDGKWSTPINILPDLGVDDDCYPTSLSFDGTELYMYRSNDFLGDIYVSYFKEGKWSKIKKLNNNINTKYWESHASISADGQKLYFTSNRKDSYGGLDIYVSTRKGPNDWGPAINLGPMINSPFNEETPFITADGRKLFFSSLGHKGMGGYDVFFSELTNSGWSKAVNVGYPLNTTDDDLFFIPVGKGDVGYYSRYEQDSHGKNDLYRVVIATRPSDMASVTQTLHKAENVATSANGDEDIRKPEVQPEGKEAEFARPMQREQIANTALAMNEVRKENTGTLDSSTTADTGISRTVQAAASRADSDSVRLNPSENVLSPKQQKAWDELLYGGLGLLAAFVCFIAFLFYRSKKRNKNQTTDKIS